MACAAQHVADFVPHEFFYFGASGAKEFAGIKFFWIFGKDFADGGSHSEAQVGVDVHLGAAHAPGYFDVTLWDTSGFLAHVSTILVDLFHDLFWNAGSAVENQRIIAETGIHERFFNRFESLQVQVLLAFK